MFNSTGQGVQNFLIAAQCFLTTGGVKCKKLGIFISSRLAYLDGTVWKKENAFRYILLVEQSGKIYMRIKDNFQSPHLMSMFIWTHCIFLINHFKWLTWLLICTTPCRSGSGTTAGWNVLAAGQTLPQSWSGFISVCRGGPCLSKFGRFKLSRRNSFDFGRPEIKFSSRSKYFLFRSNLILKDVLRQWNIIYSFIKVLVYCQ